jgi:hypothetical protein
MRGLGLLVPVFFAVQFVVILAAIVLAMIFADPQGARFVRNSR